MQLELWACHDGQGGYDIGAGDVTLASVRSIAATDGQRVADLYRQQQGADFDPRALAMIFKAAPDLLAAARDALVTLEIIAVTTPPATSVNESIATLRAAIAKAEQVTC